MDNLMIYISLSVLGFCLLSVCLVLWKMVSCIQNTAGSRFREEDRNRRDLFQWTERMMERREQDAVRRLDIARIHAQERMSQVVADARVEAKAVEKPLKTGNNKPDQVSTIEDQTMEMYQ